MNVPYFLLRLLPMWGYICPRCRREVAKNSCKCLHCGEHYGVPLKVPPKCLKDSKALEDYVHKRVFPRISAEQRGYLTQFFTTLFSDGFESGDYSEWTNCAQSGSSTVEVSGDWAHHGTKSSKHVFAQFNDDSYAYKAITSSNIVFMRIYLKVTAWTGYSSSRYVAVMEGNGQYFCDFSLGLNDTDRKLYLMYRTSLLLSATSTTALALNTVYCLEMKYDRADGEVRVYLDGSEVADLAFTGLSLSEALTRVSVGKDAYGYGGAETSCTYYVDCVVVADAYVGPEGVAVLREVVDSLGLDDGVLRGRAFVVSDGVGVADVSLRDLGLHVSDAIAFLDGVLAGKSFSVFDSVSLGELLDVLTEIVKRVSDSVSVSDAVGLGKALLVGDQIGLGDGVYVSKVLAVSDGVGLVEVVDKSVHGVVKTRVFLILGDLAVQLTGD
jgi:hypothetical protein